LCASSDSQAVCEAENGCKWETTTITTVAPTAGYTHQVSTSVIIGNISLLPNSEAAFLAQLADAMGTASGGTAAVTLSSMLVGSTYGGLADDLNETKFIIAYAALTGIHHTTVTTNNASHPAAGGRRLAIDAVVQATITNDASTDIVQAAKSVAGATTASGMTTQLNVQGVDTSALALTQSPAVKAVISATITGATTSSINTDSLASAVSSAVPGGATLSGLSVSTSGGPGNSGTGNTVQVTGTAAGTAAPTTYDDSGAIGIVAPAMAIWAAMCAFMMA